MILGIVGGIGSGKSAVARLLGELGCPTLDADRIAHDALETAEVREAVRARFGAGVFEAGGDRVDRKALGKRVFDNAQELEALNGIVHPVVVEEIRARARAHGHRRATAPSDVLVLDVSLLATSPLRSECDAILFVEADLETRIARCRERGWDEEELERRERFQATLEEKRRLARWTIDNSGTIDETRRQARQVLVDIGALEPCTAGAQNGVEVKR